MKVKICGITRKEDAMLAQECGADFVGVVMAHESRRRVSAQGASEILSSVSIPGVVVTTSNSEEELGEIVEQVGPSFIQLHSDVEPGVAGRIGEEVKVIKTISVTGGRDYNAIMERYSRYVEYFLLDAAVGGSGKVLDWGECARIVEDSGIPVFLAGGLNAENVSGAIEAVRPSGVDVGSGVEERVGIKSAEKVKKFIEVAKRG